MMTRTVASLILWFALAWPAFGQGPVSYRLTFPEPEHRWLQVEVTFPDLDPAAEHVLEVRMSRTSPGRYALHEFAKNVFDVRVAGREGRPLTATRPDPHQWDVAGHGGEVRIEYKVFGDRLDGTYLAVDTSHAHLNMPATLMWARGLEDRPARIRFEPPADSAWKVATQLYPTGDPLVFTAPNLQYLLDSPAELGAFTLRTFTVPDPGRPGRGASFRLALHHDGTGAEADRFAADLEVMAREQVAIFCEFPEFEPGTYTFIADYLPYAAGDGMEHRNSTILTSPGRLRDPGHRLGMLATAAHELFHAWNVERIRPASLEPFDFEDVNMSGELWLAEGFTSYYDTLTLHRAGLMTLEQLLSGWSGTINAVLLSPGRQLRSAVEMSRLAPLADGARYVDRTNWENIFLSYYTFGAAIALALDLSMRAHTSGRATLDDYMRAMWRVHGRPVGTPGLVAAPYTLRDVRDRLAEVAGDRAFADHFFGRYIEGREAPDYAALLERAGLSLRKSAVRRAWAGDLRLEFGPQGARVTAPTLRGSPAYHAGIAEDDLLLALDGEAVTTREALDAVLRRRRPGDAVTVRLRRRDGATTEAPLRLVEDPRLELVPLEATGGALTAGQRAFRDAWLSSLRMADCALRIGAQP